MEQAQSLFLMRMLLYCTAAMLSFFAFVPVTVSLVKHRGYCLFYTTDKSYGSVSSCGYAVAVPAIFSLVYGGCMATTAFCKTLGILDRRNDIENAKCFILNVCFDGISWFFLFVNAGINSAGFNTLCHQLFGTLDRCSDGYLYQPVFGYDRQFYVRHKMAEVASWLLWAVWLLQFGVGLVTLRQCGLLHFHCPWFCPRPRCLCTCRLVLKRKHTDGLGHVEKPVAAFGSPAGQPMTMTPTPMTGQSPAPLRQQPYGYYNEDRESVV